MIEFEAGVCGAKGQVGTYDQSTGHRYAPIGLFVGMVTVVSTYFDAVVLKGSFPRAFRSLKDCCSQNQ